jgi:hypothetical protein
LIVFVGIPFCVGVIKGVSGNTAGSTQTPSSATNTIPSAPAKQLSWQKVFTKTGSGNSNTESFQTSGGNLKLDAITMGGTDGIGTYSAVELKDDDDSYLSNASLAISTNGSEDGHGETIIRDAKAGTYYVSIISGVNWTVTVDEEK